MVSLSQVLTLSMPLLLLIFGWLILIERRLSRQEGMFKMLLRKNGINPDDINKKS